MDQKVLKNKKVLFIELNEFNYELLDSLSKKFQLRNIQKILSFYKTETFTEDLYESDYLEPWVQWVSVHTGVPSSKHEIKHLGDVPHLANPQIWEKLSEKGLTSGIWGAMNASQGKAENCLFFLPDPWTFSEEAYPKELTPLYDALRYTSKNYLNTSQLKMIQKVSRLLLFLASKKLIPSLIQEVPNLLKQAKQFKGEAFPYISLFDYLSTLLFLKMQEKYKPNFSLIFLNSLAHLQHHHWKTELIEVNPKFKYGLNYLDRALGLLLHFYKDDHILVANGLSQKNTNLETPWILYRQKDQKLFLELSGLSFLRVESHMTHDAHIFFENEKDKNLAEFVLKNAKIEGESLFAVEPYSEDPLKLFYKIIFTNKIEGEATLEINSKKMSFFDLFQPIIERTGKHIQNGTLLSNQPLFPERILNHEIFNCIENCFETKEIQHKIKVNTP